MAAGLVEIFAQQDAMLGVQHDDSGIAISHMGILETTVKDTLELVRQAPVTPVRSGHIGNWNEIWAGRVGLVDYNRYICRDFGLGSPLLHCHTSVENGERTGGDTIYLPGGLVESGKYTRSGLFVYEGSEPVALDADESRCCAYVYLADGPELRSVPAARWQECNNHFPDARSIPDLLLTGEDFLRAALVAAVERALHKPNSSARLGEILGVSIDPQGRRGRPPHYDGTVFRCEHTTYRTVGTLVDAAIECVRDGSVERDEVRSGSNYRPFPAAAAVLLFTALFDNAPIVSDSCERLHLHWGAISMSGYPPKSGGYFNQRATRKIVKNLIGYLRESGLVEYPLRFGLLPAPVFSLLPPKEFHTDVELVQELFEKVLRETPMPGADPNVAQKEIDRVAADWFAKNQALLSDYFANRFIVGRSVHTGASTIPTDGEPAPLGALERFTMQQATMLLGALMTLGNTDD